MNFMNEFTRVSEMKTTENGGAAYTSTGGGAVLDFFSIVGTLRKRNEDEIISMYRAARKENEELADKIVLYARSIRNKGGLGERRIGRILMRELAKLNPEKVIRNFQTFVDNGRFDDIYEFVNTPVEDAMWKFMAQVLFNDLKAMNEGRSISLAAKWMKSINTSSKESRELAKRFCKKVGISKKTYRKSLAALRKYGNVVEVKISAREWDDINFETVPSMAMKRYSCAFGNHCEKKFELYKTQLAEGKAKINASTLYPYDIVYEFLYGGKADENILQAQWNSLPNYIPENSRVIIMADVSGSMEGMPMAASIGLAMYAAQHNTGAYRNAFMTFTDKPHFYKLKDGDTLQENIFKIRTQVGYSTQLDKALYAVYGMAAIAQDAPEALVIISDMEIDKFSKPNACDDIVQKYQKLFNEAGLELPRLIFWNCEARQNTYLGRADNPYVNFISGVSASTFANLMELIHYTPWESMMRILEPYKFV